MIASLDRRMLAPEAQSSEDVAQVLVNLAKMHLEVSLFNERSYMIIPEFVYFLLALFSCLHVCTLQDGEHKRVVPFNFGSSADSQRVVEEVRTHPTGWGGIFDQMKAAIPPLKRSSPFPKHGEL